MDTSSRIRGGGAAESLTRELRASGCGNALGRYTLLRRIAAGGMAEVYVARPGGSGGFAKKVAIKKILPQHSHSERFVDMLVDEAKITVSLTHPNIAQVHELGLDGEDYFIVMEYVAGRPLNRLMQRVDDRGLDTIPVEHAAHVMCEVAKGLDHAHRQRDDRGRPLGIVHRDVSPQNVLLSYQGDVKLIDFGIARAEGRLNQTSAGVIKGKLRYLAPEIALGEEPDHRADIYCCGIVLFEMLTGEAMFAPKNDLEAIELATEARVRSPRSRNPRVPTDLDDIVMKALVRDRERRYQSARELVADLRRFLNHHHPAFVGSELGDFVQQMFAPEIEADRRLDELAERLARDGERFEEEEETLAAGASGLLGGRGDPASYRQLVTRVGIGSELEVPGADGGRPMVVVPAETGELARGDTPAHTPSPRRAPAPSAERARGPTRRAATAPVMAMADLTPGPLATDPAEGSATAERAAPTLVARPPGPSRAWVVAAAMLVTLGSGSAWLVANRLTARPVQIPAVAADPARAEPRPVPSVAPGALRLEVTPDVPLTVIVGDRERFSGVRSPVLVEGLEPDVVHRLVVRAEGYRAEEVTRDVAAGETKVVALALEAATGLVEVRGAAGATLRASVGEVEGALIRGVPLDSVVEVRVDRPGAAPFVKSVHVPSTERVVLLVPGPRALPPGVLVVNTRPPSAVSIDGKPRGQTPLELSLSPGVHQVRVEAPDGRAQAFKATVKSGRKPRRAALGIQADAAPRAPRTPRPRRLRRARHGQARRRVRGPGARAPHPLARGRRARAPGGGRRLRGALARRPGRARGEPRAGRVPLAERRPRHAGQADALPPAHVPRVRARFDRPRGRAADRPDARAVSARISA
jgi:tRNA A-37 threonylcarbamoyl transferase component Bud32